MKLKDLEDRIEKKKKDLGLTGSDYVLPNSGKNRTVEKRALLKAIEDNAKKQGRKPAFKSNY